MDIKKIPKRRLECLMLMANGFKTKEISKIMGITVKGVKFHQWMLTKDTGRRGQLGLVSAYFKSVISDQEIEILSMKEELTRLRKTVNNLPNLPMGREL